MSKELDWAERGIVERLLFKVHIHHMSVDAATQEIKSLLTAKEDALRKAAKKAMEGKYCAACANYAAHEILALLTPRN